MAGLNHEEDADALRKAVARPPLPSRLAECWKWEPGGAGEERSVDTDSPQLRLREITRPHPRLNPTQPGFWGNRPTRCSRV